MAQSTNFTPLAPPGVDPLNQQAPKYFVFNETGNIMMATTDMSNHPIEASVRHVFAEVAVFFAAMTRAITTTINPATGQPYSLYNYTALGNVIGGSGLFVHVTEEDIEYNTSTVGVALSRELIEALLGLASGTSELAFASGMIASMGQEALNINAQATHTDSSVANIVFVCEYLLGMPVVSALVVSVNTDTNSTVINAGPCFKTSSVSTSLKMHKDTYMFVTPAFIRQYASDLESIETDPDYLALVNSLADLVAQAPQIVSLTANGTAVAPGALSTGTTYTLAGTNFPPSATLKFVTGTGGTVTVSSQSGADAIAFTVGGTTSAASAIGVYAPNGATARRADLGAVQRVSRRVEGRPTRRAGTCGRGSGRRQGRRLTPPCPQFCFTRTCKDSAAEPRRATARTPRPSRPSTTGCPSRWSLPV